MLVHRSINDYSLQLQKIAFRQRWTTCKCVYLIKLVRPLMPQWPWPWPDDLGLRTDLDIPMMHLYDKSEVSKLRLSKVRARTGQTDRQTNSERCDRTQYHAAFAIGRNHCIGAHLLWLFENATRFVIFVNRWRLFHRLRRWLYCYVTSWLRYDWRRLWTYPGMPCVLSLTLADLRSLKDRREQLISDFVNNTSCLQNVTQILPLDYAK